VKTFVCALLSCFATGLLAEQPPSQPPQLPSNTPAKQEANPQLERNPQLDCTNLDFLKQRQPVFVGGDHDVRIGIAAQKTVFAAGEPVKVDLWIDNRSDQPTWSGGRCSYEHRGDVFDESGHRLIGVFEQQRLEAAKENKELVEVCAMTDVLVEIPAHTCKRPVEALERNLTLDYKLPPGVYYLFPKNGTDPTLFKQGFIITVRKP
jgi:hypothetical protein